jgi:predicted HicB family RNase H-like nuclease
MGNTHVVTLRMPVDLKRRLEQEAKRQGVSLNQLTNYLLNMQMTHIEAEAQMEARLTRRSLARLKKRVQKILAAVPDHDVPEWDRME